MVGFGWELLILVGFGLVGVAFGLVCLFCWLGWFVFVGNCCVFFLSEEQVLVCMDSLDGLAPQQAKPPKLDLFTKW